MGDNKKILMVNHYCGMIGGIERYIVEMTRLFKSEGRLVAALCVENRDDSAKFAEEFDTLYMFDKNRDPAEQIEKIRSDGFNAVIIHKVLDCKLLAAVVNLFPDSTAVIHDHDYYCMRSHKYFPYKRINCQYPFSIIRCSICSLMIRKKAGVPPVEFNSPFIYSRRLSLLKKVSRVVVLSEYMRKNMIENGFSSAVVEKIYPVVKPAPERSGKRLENDEESVLNILFAGQIIRGKGLDLLIEAIKMVKCKYTLRIVGRGNDEGFIKSMINDAGLTDFIDFKGFSEDIAEDYHWSDLVVVPSRWQEPFGLVGVEAFARKKAVIGFDVGGISEWLKDGERGCLIEAGNSVKLAEAIDMLSGDPELLRRMGNNGYNFISEYCSSDVFIESFK
jgi:glycosyltransferase involved in cell wall biosynthesis